MEHPVRKLRLQKAWSQEQLAQLAGISTRTVQRLENGDTPSLETLAALAAVLEVPVTELHLLQHSAWSEPASQEAEVASFTEHSYSLPSSTTDHIQRFWRLLLVCSVVAVGLLLLNAGQSGDRWWAVWPILGMSIAVVMRGWRAFATPAWRSKGRGEAAT